MSHAAFSDNDVYCYNNFLGLEPARNAVASFLENYFSPQQHNKIDPENIALSSGCAALLNSLFYSLAEEGDAVLIPAPYYAVFESDMKAIAKCIPFPVELTDPVSGPTEEDLQRAASLARLKGLNVKILLLTNPNNPLGVVYRPEVISKCVSWARNNSMHTIVDEIYALSVKDSVTNKFSSVIDILDNEFNDDVHMVWALSKDFGSSGLRVGVLYTQNKSLLSALGNLNVFSGVSNPMQMITSELLSDVTFVDSFLQKSRDLLQLSYITCTQNLDEMGITYVRADAGLFVYCDFSSALPEITTFEKEKEFSDLLNKVAKVVLAPGECQRDKKPGKFRLCYSWVNIEVLQIALERIRRLVMKTREIGLENRDLIQCEEILTLSK